MKKTIRSRIKSARFDDGEINLDRIIASIPATIDFTKAERKRDRELGVIRNDSYDAIEGIEIDEIIVNEETSEGIILFHVKATGEKFRAFHYWGYEGRDFGIYRGHDIIWRHTDIPYEQRVEQTWDEEGKIFYPFIEGTMTNRLNFDMDEKVEDSDSFTGWTFKTSIKTEPCHIEDLREFFQAIFKEMGLDV